jgi:hypothetical protein
MLREPALLPLNKVPQIASPKSTVRRLGQGYEEFVVSHRKAGVIREPTAEHVIERAIHLV